VNVWIAPLIFITFLENAFKHGVSNNNPAAWVTISIEVMDNQCIYTVENSKNEEGAEGQEKSGIGLQNVQRRLQLSYPDKHQLFMQNDQDKYSVKLNLFLD